MQCVILLGGKGTRMAGHTGDKVPKCMITFKGLPIIDFQLQNLIARGVTDILLSVGHLKEHIINYVQNKSWGANIQFVDDGPTPLGTGGALRKALAENKLQNKFMMIYGDSFLPIDFQALTNYYLSQSKPALMTIYKNTDVKIKNNIHFDRGLVRYNKFNPPNGFQYIDYGLTFLTSQIIQDHVPLNVNYDIASTFSEISAKSMLAGYEMTEKFYETGSPEGLIEFQKWIFLNGSQFNYS